MPNQFTPHFYKRFYENPRTRVTTREEMQRRARAVAAMVSQLDIDVARILDAGCGLGWMRDALLEAFPKAKYVGLEVSQHLCERYGWVNASLATYRPKGQFDLVICYDVLQYLSDREAVRAINNLATICRGALYFTRRRSRTGNTMPIALAATATSACGQRNGIEHDLRAAFVMPASEFTFGAAFRCPCGSSNVRASSHARRYFLVAVASRPESQPLLTCTLAALAVNRMS
jgi:hypothetical protein